MKTQIENAYRALPVVGLFAAIGYISGIGHSSQYVAGCVEGMGAAAILVAALVACMPRDFSMGAWLRSVPRSQRILALIVTGGALFSMIAGEAARGGHMAAAVLFFALAVASFAAARERERRRLRAP